MHKFTPSQWHPETAFIRIKLAPDTSGQSVALRKFYNTGMESKQ